MAKIHLDRLSKKYDGVKVSGNNYTSLIKEIIFENSKTISNFMFNKSNDKFESFAKKFNKKGSKLILPNAEEVIPKKNLQVIKAAQNGQLITDTLKDRLMKTLKERLKNFEEPYITKKGIKAGRINPKLIKEFKEDLKKVFVNYNKRNKKIGIPTNIHTIAVMETRSLLNEIKTSYTNRLIDTNPDIIVMKTWIHNPSLSKEPRKGHGLINRRQVPFREVFKVPRYIKLKGKLVKLGITNMQRPHDSTAPLDQIMGCECDLDITIKKKKRG